jgi:hypothetical protein
VSGTWHYNDYTFKEKGSVTPPAITVPSAAATIGGSTTFTWTPGKGMSAFQLRIGTYPGWSNLYDSGWLANTVTSKSAYIYFAGVNVYVRLSYLASGAWSHKDYTFKEKGTATPPVLIGPSATAPIGGPTTFVWNSGIGWSAIQLRIGTYPGWANIYDSGLLAYSPNLPDPHARSATIPSDGVNFYVRLLYLMNGAWSYKDYTFKEKGTAYSPVLIAPSAAAPIGGVTTFTWTPGKGISAFQLRVQIPMPNLSTIYDSGQLANTVTQQTVTIPKNGQTIYVRLYYLANGTWTCMDRIFHESS